SVAIPHAIVSAATGAPTRKYSTNPMCSPRASARSATMRFAIEPSSVRLPANVELIAITSQVNVGAATFGTTGNHRMTAGTFETMIDSAAIAADVTTALCTGAPVSARPATEVSDATS